MHTTWQTLALGTRDQVYGAFLSTPPGTKLPVEQETKSVVCSLVGWVCCFGARGQAVSNKNYTHRNVNMMLYSHHMSPLLCWHKTYSRPCTTAVLNNNTNTCRHLKTKHNLPSLFIRATTHVTMSSHFACAITYVHTSCADTRAK